MTKTAVEEPTSTTHTPPGPGPAQLPAVTKVQERALLAAGALKWSKAEVLALKEICCPKDATPAEILSFWYVCKRTGLDPFARQIYLVRYGKGDDESGSGRCTIQVGIDGFRLVSMDAGGYAGSDEPEFKGEGEADGIDEIYAPIKVKHPMTCKVTVWRMVEGQKVAFVGIARWAEFSKYVAEKDRDGKKTGKKRLNAMWSKMPHNQLAKCAEAQAHRKSAPMRLSGVYAPEEIGTIIDVVGTPVGGAIAAPQRASLPGPAAASSTTKPGPAAGATPGEQLWNTLMDLVGGNEQQAQGELKRLTAFKGRNGDVPGVTDWKKLSGQRAEIALNKLNEEIGRTS